MTNPNQLCDVLLFKHRRMLDEELLIQVREIYNVKIKIIAFIINFAWNKPLLK